MRRFLYKIVIIIFFFNAILYANDIIESQPQIIFEIEKLKGSSENLELQVDFNKAVLHFERNELQEALKLFKKTSRDFEIPSLLNMGIIYFKLQDLEKAKELFNKIYSKKANLINQPYSFISSCYYLFEITKDDKYMLDLVTIFQNSEKLGEYNTLITDIKDVILRELANRYISIKDYDNAFSALNAMSYSIDLKKAMLYIKLGNFARASKILKKLKEESVDDPNYNKILWISTYCDLKQNKFNEVQDTLDLINDRKKSFQVNTKMPFEIFFNKDLYSSEDYYKSVMKFDRERTLEFIYYFSPFVFSDSKEIIYDSVKGFIYQDDVSVANLEDMVEYNTNFANLIKLDPILRIKELQKAIKKDSKAYTYYNLALAYAQVNDLISAYTNFEKAYKLNPANRLYSVMFLITAEAINFKLDEKQKANIDRTLREKGGMYSFFAKEVYRLFINNAYDNIEIPNKYKDAIFCKALDFLSKMNENKPLKNHPLFEEYERDAFIYLLKLVQRDDKESNYDYFSRIQDTLSLKYNDNFIDNSWVVVRYYFDILKAVGIFNSIDFNIETNNNPSYLLARAFSSLYLQKPQITIYNLNRLKEEFAFENRFTMYLLVAAFLESKRVADASIQISLIKAFYKDLDTDFLTAIQLIQHMNISSAKQFLEHKYKNPYIDFRISGFDEFLLSL